MSPPTKTKAPVGPEAKAEAVSADTDIVRPLAKQDKGFFAKALEGKVRPARYSPDHWRYRYQEHPTCGCCCATSRGPA